MMVMVARQFQPGNGEYFAFVERRCLLGYLQDFFPHTVHRQTSSQRRPSEFTLDQYCSPDCCCNAHAGLCPLSLAGCIKVSCTWCYYGFSPRFFAGWQINIKLSLSAGRVVTSKSDVLSKSVGLSISIALLLVINPGCIALVFWSVSQQPVACSAACGILQVLLCCG
jgi:hypothetical protein